MTATAAVAETFALRDGGHVLVRPVRCDDEAALEAFLEQLSLETRRLRFFTACCDLRAHANRAAAPNGAAQFGLIALDPDGRVVGHACYVREDDGARAEVAVEVADDLHRRGLGTHLVAELARVAQEHAVTAFYAEVLPDNHEMLTVFHDGFAPTQRYDRGVVKVAFPTSNWIVAQRLCQ